MFLLFFCFLKQNNRHSCFGEYKLFLPSRALDACIRERLTRAEMSSHEKERQVAMKTGSLGQIRPEALGHTSYA
ncbi:hypothetical protein EUGRSUZ_C00254 [Eucalyptus grandis]|uniref:Uncharacterized protein n=2 Tax=Eucalyptus grandis TaxID=71139 RepID=A0ACC3L9B5_EUCGR|nr:hypothetical protein EUGRSUZ_C00254 [Eucalyptus grandis]